LRIHFLVAKDICKGGGIETYTRGVGRRLVERGHDITVYSTGTGSGRPQVLDGMEVVWLPRVRPYWAEKVCGAVAAAYRQRKSNSADIVHLHSVAAGSMAPFLRRGAPCVVQMHGVEWMRSRWGGVAKGVLKAMEHYSIASGDALTAVSQTQCDYYSDQYGKPCEYIPTAVETKPQVSPKLILELGLTPRRYVLFAARLVPEKGLHYLIPAYRRLNTDCTLVIAGGAGSSPTYQRQLTTLAGGDPRIRFLGDVRGRLLEELFSNAAIFAQPSELEGLSIGLIEAMSYGLPCVASNIPENLEVIGDAGLRFISRDTNDLERVLGRALAGNELERDAVGAMARRRVQELFSWDLVVNRLESLYDRVLARNQASDRRLVNPRAA
jgi:glycosyltransferase involved in cell wall biosynthesis